MTQKTWNRLWNFCFSSIIVLFLIFVAGFVPKNDNLAPIFLLFIVISLGGLHFLRRLVTRSRFIKAKPYGTEIWVNRNTEERRPFECLCFNCLRLFENPKCPIASEYYKLGIAKNTLIMMTGCPDFKDWGKR